MSLNLVEFIKKGGIFDNIEGTTPEQIYKAVSEKISLPEGISADTVYDALCAREKIMSTAVGNGIALPHARTPVIENEADQRICIVYLKDPIDMSAPDGNPVKTMFIILTQNSQTHLAVLSSLVGLFQKIQFKKLLDNHASEAEILQAVEELA